MVSGGPAESGGGGLFPCNPPFAWPKTGLSPLVIPANAIASSRPIMLR